MTIFCNRPGNWFTRTTRRKRTFAARYRQRITLRSVSFADEACLNWSNDLSRPGLARMFDHGLMKKASRKITDLGKTPFVGEDPVIVHKLRSFAGLFIPLQEQRHEADYNVKDAWTLTQSLKEVLAANRAFATWREIRTEKISQDLLVSLLIRPRD